MAVARETYSPDPLVGHEMGCRGNEGSMKARTEMGNFASLAEVRGSMDASDGGT